MAQRLPYKDDYDPAPYTALGQRHHAGEDLRQTVADLIADTRIKPGFMAKRLNLAGIPAPDGGAWTWQTVQNARHREEFARALRFDRELHERHRDNVNAPLPPLRADDEDYDWRQEKEVVFHMPWGQPVTRGELEAED